MEKSNYMAFLQEARQFIPQERIYTDELRRLAWGTDAGFYRLIPQIVIRSEGEEEISRLLKLAGSHNLPVTFRAAGTSNGSMNCWPLSGGNSLPTLPP